MMHNILYQTLWAAHWKRHPHNIEEEICESEYVRVINVNYSIFKCAINPVSGISFLCMWYVWLLVNVIDMKWATMPVFLPIERAQTKSKVAFITNLYSIFVITIHFVYYPDRERERYRSLFTVKRIWHKVSEECNFSSEVEWSIPKYYSTMMVILDRNHFVMRPLYIIISMRVPNTWLYIYLVFKCIRYFEL